MKYRVLIIKRADIEYDIRCQRLAKHLSSSYDVTILGTDVSSKLPFKQIKIADYDHAKLSVPGRAIRKIRREILLRNLQEKSFEFRLSKDRWIDELIRHLNQNNYNVIVACDIDTIAAALESKNKAQLVGDMHEHAPTELANKPRWTETVGNYRKWQCELYLPNVQQLFTVSDSLARLFEKEFGVQKIQIMRNTAPYHPRTREKSEKPPKEFIHHGIAAQVRELEVHALLAAALGSQYSISMLLKPVEFEYYHHLKHLQKLVKNFHILNPIEPNLMVREIAKFEAGIYLLKPTTSQLEVTLPNKFFEFIQARLPVFTGGLKEVDELVTKYGIGINLGTFDPLEAAEIIKENQNLDWKTIHENLDIAARDLSSESEFKKISNTISELMSK